MDGSFLIYEMEEGIISGGPLDFLAGWRGGRRSEPNNPVRTYQEIKGHDPPAHAVPTPEMDQKTVDTYYPHLRRAGLPPQVGRRASGRGPPRGTDGLRRLHINSDMPPPTWRDGPRGERDTRSPRGTRSERVESLHVPSENERAGKLYGSDERPLDQGFSHGLAIDSDGNDDETHVEEVDKEEQSVRSGGNEEVERSMGGSSTEAVSKRGLDNSTESEVELEMEEEEEGGTARDKGDEEDVDEHDQIVRGSGNEEVERSIGGSSDEAVSKRGTNNDANLEVEPEMEEEEEQEARMARDKGDDEG